MSRGTSQAECQVGTENTVNVGGRIIISMWWMIGLALLLCLATNDVTVEPPLKETPNKGQDSEHQNFTFLYNSANTLITSEERHLTIIMNRITCPKSYVIQRFHCIPIN